MMNSLRLGLAVAATASLGFAHGDGVGKNGPDGKPLLENLFQDGMTVTYAPGEGITIQPANKQDFSLNFGGQLQPLFSGLYGSDVTDVNTFSALSARTRFGGHVFNEDVTYFLQIEHAKAPGVLDGWIGWRFLNNEDYSINLRVGEQKMRSSLQADASLTDTDLEFARRSIATDFFANNRATGALLEGAAMKGDNGHRLHWHLGAMNNATSNFGNGDPVLGALLTQIGVGTIPSGATLQTNESNELNFTAGVMFSPNGSGTSESWSEGDLEHSGSSDLVVGANFLIGNDTDPTGTTATDSDMYTLNLFAGFKTGSGIAAQGELWVRNDELDAPGATDQDSLGFYGQVSYTMAPGEGTQWGFGARYSMIDVDDVFTASEIAVNANAYYHKHKLKTQVQLRMMDADPETGTEADAVGADVLFTLMF
jgi:hypothetical protein